MYDFLLTPKEQELKKEVRRFVRDEITAEFLRKMDNNEINYPRDFVEKLADKGLRGIQCFPGNVFSSSGNRRRTDQQGRLDHENNIT